MFVFLGVLKIKSLLVMTNITNSNVILLLQLFCQELFKFLYDATAIFPILTDK